MKAIRSFLRDEQGQDMIEYTLLIAFVLFTVVGLSSGFHGSIVGVAAQSDSPLPPMLSTLVSRVGVRTTGSPYVASVDYAIFPRGLRPALV
jgi:Flp pilus assembly pilin Flp